MATVDNILLSSLLLDVQNPRLEIQNSQRDALHAMAMAQGEKLLRLAKDIVDYGVNPTELPIVLATGDDKKRYIVLEGNRRVAALKFLSTPDLISGAVQPSVAKRFKVLGERFQRKPIDTLNCLVVSTKEEADHWIALRHTGENQGIGIVNWGAIESERFTVRRSGKKSPQLQILDLVMHRGALSEKARNNINNIAITNLERLVGDRDVRAKLGIEVNKGEVLTKYEDKEVIKGLTKIVEDLALKRINVTDIDNKKDRLNYINRFRKRELPDRSKEGTDLRSLGAPPGETVQPTQPKKKSKPSSRVRTTLIPRDCILEIIHTRINNIYVELKQLNIDNFPNAGAVMFRVFIELSVDEFIDKKNLTLHPNSKLKDKLHVVANYLQTNNNMTKQQLQPVKKAAAGQDLLASAIPTMHAYVHNKYFSPIPGDLKTAWDDLQLFVEKIWS